MTRRIIVAILRFAMRVYFRRVEVLVFLTPRIVKNDSVNEIIKQIEAERMHYTEADAEALHGPLFA